jgi:hypothetical protein
MSATDEIDEIDEIDEMADLGHNSLADLYVDAEAMRDEYERRGFAFAETSYRYDLLNDSLPSLLAHIALKMKRGPGVKSLAQAEMMARDSEEYRRQIEARALAKREMIRAKFRADAQKMCAEFIRSNVTTHRELAKIR